jgi:hypothetical protein
MAERKVALDIGELRQCRRGQVAIQVIYGSFQNRPHHMQIGRLGFEVFETECEE